MPSAANELQSRFEICRSSGSQPHKTCPTFTCRVNPNKPETWSWRQSGMITISSLRSKGGSKDSICSLKIAGSDSPFTRMYCPAGLRTSSMGVSDSPKIVMPSRPSGSAATLAHKARLRLPSAARINAGFVRISSHFRQGKPRIRIVRMK